MDKIINLSLMRNPLNWGIVWTFALIASFGFTVVAHGLSKSGGCGCSDPNAPD